MVGSRLWEDIPKLDIEWIRGYEPPNWEKTRHHLAVGLRDSGKSALGENIACHYPQIIDIYGSRDCEGLAWLRSGVDDILLVIGDNVDMDSSYKVVRVGDLDYKTLNDYEITITVPRFYSSEDSYFKGLASLTQHFYYRLKFSSMSIILIREAANLIYSTLAKGDYNRDAKAEVLRFQREMRHFGYSLFVDAIRWTSIAKEIRDLADYIYFKDQGYVGLGGDVSWLYQFVNPASMRGLSPEAALLLTRSGAIGDVVIDYPLFHKEAGEDLLEQFELSPEFSEEVEESSSSKVGDMEHAEMVRLYIDEELSIGAIAEELHRSKSTVHSQLLKHNKAVNLPDGCAVCGRAGADTGDTEINLSKR